MSKAKSNVEVKWIKININIFDDEKMKIIDSLPEADAIIVIWFKLLALAGKNNDSGAIYLTKKIPITDEMLSTIFNRPLNVVRLALRTFEEFEMITIQKHINIINWEKHQNVAGLEKIKQQNAERQKKYREKKALENNSNVTVTLRNGTEESRVEESRKEENRKEESSSTATADIKNICTRFPDRNYKSDFCNDCWKQNECNLEFRLHSREQILEHMKNTEVQIDDSENNLDFEEVDLDKVKEKIDSLTR